MRHPHLPPCLLILLPVLCGCGGPSGPRTPDGASRGAVNTIEAIERYQSLQRRDPPAPPATPTQQRILQLEQQVEALRRQLAAWRQPPGASTPKPPASALTVIDGVEIAVLRDRMVLRFPQALGQAVFSPSAEIAALLRHNADQARRVEVRGRTDAVRADPLNRRLAAQRAALARRFMLDSGVAPSKLRTSVLAAGGRIADNGTQAGRDRNRRIEIELAGLVTPPLATAFQHWSPP